jgi:signal peptidase II
MLQGMNPVFIGLAVLVSGAIIYYYQQVDRQDWLIRLALMMELGGAIGNLVDRIQYGHVVDFVSVGRFPVFNIADACITVGVVVLLIGVWVQEKREKNRILASTNDQAPDEMTN